MTIAVYSLLGCAKDEDAAVPFDAEPVIEAHLTANGITDAQRTASGLYYVIEEPGSSERAALDSLVAFTFTSKLTDGTEVSPPNAGTTPSYSILRGILPAFQEGMQLIGPGGKIKLISPPRLAYGSGGSPPVPPNSVVVFDVDFIGFTPNSAEIIESYLREEGIDSASTTASGLTYIIHEPGDADDKPTRTSEVEAIYRGTFLSGEQFDSSNGAPRSFFLNNVIRGWTEGLQLIGKGGSMTLFVPYELGYGAAGTGTIPPFSVLRFEVELVEVR